MLLLTDQDGTAPPPSVAPTPLAADSGVSSVAGPYKLTICKFWERGACLAGDSCTYAHGAEELQPPKAQQFRCEDRYGLSPLASDGCHSGIELLVRTVFESNISCKHRALNLVRKTMATAFGQ